MTTYTTTTELTRPHPKVFISYSWDSEMHKRWVLDLATALVGAGVDVILDVWNLQPGQDQIRFMEESIAQSDYILIICTLSYASKSNDREGGAGYETTILTANLVDDLDTRKFIPVLRDGQWGISGSIPRWLSSRAGIDLRKTPYDQENFQQLLRTVHGQVAARPALGEIPSFAEVGASAITLTPPKLPEANRYASGSNTRLLEDLALDDKEIELLWHAAHDAGGQICHIKAIGGERLSANSHTFPEVRDARSHAEWFGALRQLESVGLVEGIGYDPDYYRLTAQGWEASDALNDFAIWRATTITVERRYMGNKAPETVVLACKRIIRLPREFCCDGYSIKEPKRLIAEGIDPSDPKLQGGFPFEPTHTGFTDGATGEEYWFHTYPGTEVRGRTLRLQING